MRRYHHHGLFIGAALMGMVAGSLSALGAESEIKQVMDERHESFEHMGETFEDLEKEIKRKSPDLARIQQNANQIDAWARDQINWFPIGSGPESGFKTDAKAEVWKQPAEFRALQDKFIVEAGALKTIAADGPVEDLATQIEKTGQVCSQCHETYRKQFSLFSIFGF